MLLLFYPDDQVAMHVVTVILSCCAELRRPSAMLRAPRLKPCTACRDGENKKRLLQSPKYPTSIAAMAFNSESTYLAVASSYTHEQGDCEHPPDAIYLRPITESEIRPKPRK